MERGDVRRETERGMLWNAIRCDGQAVLTHDALRLRRRSAGGCMTHYAQWASYTGSASIILAIMLLVITGVLVFVGLRLLRKPIEFKRPGVSLSALLAVFFLIAAVLFLVA